MMLQHFATPRLLPLTIFALALLLMTKSADLTRRTYSVLHRPTVPTLYGAQAATPSHEAAPAHGAAKPPAAPPAPTTPPEPQISDAERSVLLDLRARRQELEAREATIAARESLLQAAEQKLAARVTELQTLQKKLEALETARKEREDASWQGLVKLYEAMKPRDAATIFNDLDMPVLLQVVDRMKEAKAAPVLAAMQPEKAREVTAQLAQMRTRRDDAPDKGSPTKG